MVKLIRNSDEDSGQIEERLQNLSLNRKLVLKEDQEHPILVHNNKEFHGLKAISKYIDELEKLVEEWYECRCDKWEEFEEK